MQHRFWVPAGVAMAALLTMTARAESGTYEVPKTPDGVPDYNGIWQAMGSAHWDLEDHNARQGAAPILGALGAIPAGRSVVAGGTIPYQDWALAQREENRANWVKLDPAVKCYMPGIPRATYMPFPFQIVQSTDVILIAYEYAEANRILYVDQPEITSQVDAWMGHSNAHWEGDTLVVRVTGQMPDTWFDRAGNHHSWEMVVEERWTFSGPDHIDYEATITDPQTFTEPWTISLPLYRRMEPNMQLLEFKCAEFSEEFLYGEWRKEGTPIGNPPQ